MAFYEEWGKKLSRTGQQAVQKTKNIAESTKFNLEIGGLEKEIQEAYGEIGRIYYQKYGNNPVDDEIAGYVRLISEKEAAIEEYKSQIRQSKGLVLCKNCGVEINATAIFCHNCGARTEYEEPVENKGTICPNCGTPVEEGYIFCGNCGTRIVPDVMEAEEFVREIPEPEIAETEELVQEIPEPEIAETEELVQDIPEPEAAETEELVQESFANEMPAPEIFEPVNPEPVIPIPEEKTEEAENIPHTVRRFCPQCGAAIEAGDVFCTFCGHRMG